MDRTGSVTTFKLQDGKWFEAGEVFGPKVDGLFGRSVDTVDYQMIVGASFVLSNTTSSKTRTGEAYIYQYKKNRDEWQQIGSSIIGKPTDAAEGEEFGAAVGISSPLRVVVGAPNRKLGKGAVYTFEYRKDSDRGLSGWVLATKDPLITWAGSGEFGTSIAITDDGAYLPPSYKLVTHTLLSIQAPECWRELQSQIETADASLYMNGTLKSLIGLCFFKYQGRIAQIWEKG
jgi:hypothetical protein